MTAVMVLNADMTPLHTVSIEHAVRMLVRQVAEVHETDGDALFGIFPRPRVLRLVKFMYAKWLHSPACFGSRNVIRRDKGVCAYCAGRATTVDHVVPRSRGGRSTWTNTVAACEACNGRKGSRTPVEARMPLLVEPWTPTRSQLHDLVASGS